MTELDDDAEWLLLDKTTGLVHQYEGQGYGGPNLCDCELIEHSFNSNRVLVTITRRHLEIGIWEEAACLQEKSD